MPVAPKKSRIQQLIEAIKGKRWHDANVLTSRILEAKVMDRLSEERKGMFKNGFMKECPVDGDGGSPMTGNPKLEKEAFPGAAPKFKKKIKEGDEKPGQDGEEIQEGLGCKCDCKQCDRGDHCGAPGVCAVDENIVWSGGGKKPVTEGYYRVTYMDGKKEKTMKFQGSPSDARSKVASEAGAGKTIVDVETLSQSEYAEADE